MVIRPMAGIHFLGEIGRSAGAMGAQGGPTAFLSGKDEKIFNAKTRAGGGLYSAKPLFKIIGAVELMSDDYED